MKRILGFSKFDMLHLNEAEDASELKIREFFDFVERSVYPNLKKGKDWIIYFGNNIIYSTDNGKNFMDALFQGSVYVIYSMTSPNFEAEKEKLKKYWIKVLEGGPAKGEDPGIFFYLGGLVTLQDKVPYVLPVTMDSSQDSLRNQRAKYVDLGIPEEGQKNISKNLEYVYEILKKNGFSGADIIPWSNSKLDQWKQTFLEAGAEKKGPEKSEGIKSGDSKKQSGERPESLDVYATEAAMGSDSLEKNIHDIFYNHPLKPIVQGSIPKPLPFVYTTTYKGVKSEGQQSIRWGLNSSLQYVKPVIGASINLYANKPGNWKPLGYFYYAPGSYSGAPKNLCLVYEVSLQTGKFIVKVVIDEPMIKIPPRGYNGEFNIPKIASILPVGVKLNLRLREDIIPHFRTEWGSTIQDMIRKYSEGARYGSYKPGGQFDEFSEACMKNPALFLPLK
jgi:hypothetical protein